MKYQSFEPNRLDKSNLIKHARTIVLYLVIAIFVVAVPLVSISTFDRIRDDRRRAEFLYDFDYLINALEENFPLFDIIYLRRGVDMRELGQEIRDYIAYEANELNYRSFSRLIRNNFFTHAGQSGNLGILSFLCMELEVALLQSNWRGNESRIIRYTSLLENARYHAALLEIPTTREFSLNRWTPAWIFTDIIEEERIAFLSFSILPVIIEQREIDVINSFYRKIENFEHLIIDLRGIEGRNSHFFHHVIAGPLIQGLSLDVNFRHFFMDGEFNQLYFSDIPSIQLNSTDAVSLTQLLGGQYVLSDEWNMDYYFYELHSVSRRNPRANFNGKIWMLIDGNTRSGGQQVASFYKNTGFATFVGETTGGSFGSPTPWGANYFTLPNTGFVIRYNPTLVVDSQGRPLELGTEPHYFNRPGLDALETVLQMIYEGCY